jgi:hypothetical protein
MNNNTYSELEKMTNINFDLNSKIIKTQFEINKRLFLIERNHIIFRDFVSETDYTSTITVLDSCLLQLEEVSTSLKEYPSSQLP